MRLLTQVVLLSCFTVVPAIASADAITGIPPSSPTSSSVPSGGDENLDLTIGTSLFDESGNPLLQVAPAQFLDLSDQRQKLRWLSNGLLVSAGSSGLGGGSGSLVDQGALSTLDSGVSSTVHEVGQSGNIQNIPLGSGGSSPAVAAPEPSTLLLLMSGLALGARRWTRKTPRAS